MWEVYIPWRRSRGAILRELPQRGQARRDGARARQGDDPSRDNDLTLPLAGTSLWATPVFTMPADGSLVTGLDLGLCAVTFDPQYTVRLPLVRR